jgi:hypothetical protein
MSSSKKLTCKGTLRQVFISVQHSLWFNSLPPPFSVSKCSIYTYTDSVWLGAGGGVEFLLKTIFCKEFNTLCLTRFRIWAGHWTASSSVADPNPHVLGLLDPDPLVRGMDPDPSITKQIVR